MTNSDESREHAHGVTGSAAPGLSRGRFLQATGLGAAAATALPDGWSGTIRDVKHVVILMQENRSFDHYFGTLRGVGTAEVTTYPELLQKAGISWRVYTNDQVGDSGSFPDFFLGDFGDNPLWFYQQYNTTNSRNGGTGTLAARGAVTPWQTDAGAPSLSKTHAAYVLSSFIKGGTSGTLRQVSWIVARRDG